jgi:replicative DNA helicase Mcm
LKLSDAGFIDVDPSLEAKIDVETIDYYSLWKKVLKKKSKSYLSVNAGLERSLFLDVGDLDNKLFDQVYYTPDEAKRVVKEVLTTEKLVKIVPNIRFINFPKKTSLKDLRSDMLGKYLSISGIVRNIKKTEPFIMIARFNCQNCSARKDVPQDGFELSFPDFCDCGKTKWVLDRDKSVMMDYQMLKLQDSPEGLRGGEAPHEVEVWVSDDLCGRINAGNRVVLNGVLKAIPKGKSKVRMQNVFIGDSLSLLERDFIDIDISDEDVNEIVLMSQDKDVYNNMVGAIAPSIYGHSDVKEAVLLQLFGGVRVLNSDDTYSRGDIHVLLVGDPGVAKSKLLDSVIQLCPRGVKASGGTSSKAGLTAVAVKDTEGVWTLEAGAVVLADQGELIIDEIDKMSPDDRAALHGAMEQQEVAVTKAGINTVLQARCSILAAANPKSGRFDSTYSIDLAEQIDLPPTLLSRFDLIFCMTDIPESKEDENVAEFILQTHGTPVKPKYSNLLIRKYIGYAKKNVFPVLSPAANKIIKDYYVEVRGLSGKNGQKAVPLTARQLEALIRLAKAAARVRLSQKVTEMDARRAVNILDSCLRHIAYNPKTGSFDIDKIATKMSSEKRDGMRELRSVIKKLQDENGGAIKTTLVMEEMEKLGYDPIKIEQWIETGRMSAEFVFPRNDLIKVFS